MDPIRQRLQSLVVPVEWNGSTIYLRQLDVPDGLELSGALKDANLQESDELNDKGLRFYILLISKCYVDAEGRKVYDSDEGREVLRTLPFDDVVTLGKLANEHCGIGDEPKKN